MFEKARFIIPVVALSVFVTGCAGNKDKEPVYVNDMEISDPWEDYNRGVFAFNDALDEAILEPTARGYRTVTPDFLEDGIGNMLVNLRSPLDFGNQILQGDGEGALEILTRAMINTTFGVLGFVDLAADTGIPYEKEDFGQTLAVWGVDYGPYLVLPLYGPGTVRDHTANFGEAFIDPVRLYLFNTDEEEIYYIISGVSVIDKRAELLNVLEDLKENSIDYYAAVRSTYYQNREALIHDRDDENQSVPEVPSFDEDY